ncbi:hypothetical protein TRAPUB_14150 [Trametes pubescens]|uniref:Uncharacterized protein n=1 Tax=Trametes pubescens TaxID=154538 RepID=A0A1M2VP74_TRAPU|nr:hypothetical protein TRAPUB_14150 [Trametes pubescens]
MPLDAAHAIWADTGFNYSGSQILSQSFAMICGALVPLSLQICLDKEPDTKVAATHRRSVMSYLRELLQLDMSELSRDTARVRKLERLVAQAHGLRTTTETSIHADTSTTLAPLKTHQRPFFQAIHHIGTRRATTDCGINGDKMM